MSSVEKAIQGKVLGLPTDRKIGIQMLEGADRGHAFVLSKKSRVVFGREAADVDVKDPAVSRMHCAVEVYGDVVVLRDLESASGTFLNDFQIKAEVLKEMDKFRLGSTVFQIVIKKTV